MQKTNIDTLLENVLGSTISVECLLPNTSLGDDHAHKQNFVVKVTCNKNAANQRSIIIPGDANGTLIKNIARNNPGCFTDVDVVIFSHHGSNENKEQKLIKLIQKNRNIKTKPLLGIISSAIKSPDCIPKYFVDAADDKSTFIQKIQNLGNAFPVVSSAHNPILTYCSPHFITLYDNSISASYMAPVISEDGKNIIPVFCTGDLKNDGDDLYYKITIPSDGSKITMTGQRAKILYQTVSAGMKLDADIAPIQLLEMTVSNVSLATGAALKEKMESATMISPVIKALSEVIDPQKSVITSEAISKEIAMLKCIMSSGYIGKITILGRLLNLMENVVKNITLADSKDGLLLDTRKESINSLANLLLSYMNTIVVPGQPIFLDTHKLSLTQKNIIY